MFGKWRKKLFKKPAEFYSLSEDNSTQRSSPFSKDLFNEKAALLTRQFLESKTLQRLVALSLWIQTKTQPSFRHFDWMLIRNCMLLFAFSFVLASSVSTFAANYAMSYSTKDSRKKTSDETESSVAMSGVSSSGSTTGPSGGELRRTILARNIFNASGELAPEVDESAQKIKKTTDLDFEAVPCKEESVPVTVVGTIFTGDPFQSFVTVKDAKISDTDTYKAGAVVIDHEDYEVYKVDRGMVEFRKGDEKICVALKGFETENVAASGGPAGTAENSQAVRPTNVENIDFESSYVQQEIGPGYANILNSAKLIPDIDGAGKVTGFKIIAIASGSLFEKMKLQNGDVINEVNGVNLQDASQGFKLYQSLQEDRSITVKLTRGNESMIRNVNVK